VDNQDLSKILKRSLTKEFYEGIKKGLSEGVNSELFLFLINEGQKMSTELEQYKLDYEKYKTGVFLWWNEDYPRLINFLNLFSDSNAKIQFSCYKNMKLVVKEYYNLIKDVENSNSNLLNKELIESNELVFKKNINPKNILQNKSSLMKLINDELKAYVVQINPRLYDYIKQITPEFKNYVDSIKEILKKLISTQTDNLIEGIRGEQEDFQIKIVEENDKFTELINEQTQKFTSLMKSIQEDTKVRMEDILLYAKELETSHKLIESGIFKEKIINIRNSIMLVKDLDSFNIHFCRFINRIFHILTKNNRNYKNKENCYFNIKPKPYNSKTRKKLEKFISNQLKTKYPSLATFLLKGFNFNEIRQLDAHEIPDKIQVSDNNKIAFIPHTGDDPDIQIDLEDIDRFINSYCFFIDALGLY